ncbi:vitamin K-dependent gamma-carboxylase-like protein [Haloactinopolyspora alba]|uniref:Vitamin K-dependent gamma-carboxylase-like protein n=1 Tax=Haloactinopolyspora alba TaxID=648780 RepID=A0A2P8E9K9_9ACTN|nr:HTTM domain-containing protein [Haloactinopolyspora alba]PSL06107.1 vitamin K-dependent gamma-carboxylase-like protein [Haloactinopolyspora alba]
MIRRAYDAALDHIGGRIEFGERWLLDARRASYGVAVVRIIFGLGAVWFLLANWSNRHYLWGDASQWMSPLERNGGFDWPFTLFAGGSAPTELTVKLLVVLALAIALTLGWRTRVVAPLLLVCWVSLIESNPLYGDQSDNIFRILLIYLCFADISGRWSLDARRRARAARGTAGRLLATLPTPPARVRRNASLLATLLHNLSVLAVAGQVCIIYVASAMYKIQGEYWQDGTAVFYPLQVSHYRPWPFLNDLLSANAFGVLAVSYFSVFIQLFFPLLLMRRTTRVFGLVGVLGMHAGIAVIMGLPFFSLFIMAGDQVFVRDSTYRAVAQQVRGAWQRRRRRRPAPDEPPDSGEPADDSLDAHPTEPAGPGPERRQPAGELIY